MTVAKCICVCQKHHQCLVLLVTLSHRCSSSTHKLHQHVQVLNMNDPALPLPAPPAVILPPFVIHYVCGCGEVRGDALWLSACANENKERNKVFGGGKEKRNTTTNGHTVCWCGTVCFKTKLDL